jgi:hypothetical protein
MIFLKSIFHVLAFTLIVVAVTGCIVERKSNDTASRMLPYLKEKYGESFEEEAFEEGSTLFPEMYGGDKMMAHPAENNQIPFYVHKNVKSGGFNDNYILSDMSYRFTEKYKHDIQNFDEREKVLKLSFGCSDVIDDLSYLTSSVDEFAKDEFYDCRVHLEVAVNGSPIDQDKEFITNAYNFMKERTTHDFTITVGYIDKDRFEEAKELIRIAHTINFSWTIIEDALIATVQMDSENDSNSPSFNTY